MLKQGKKFLASMVYAMLADIIEKMYLTYNAMIVPGISHCNICLRFRLYAQKTAKSNCYSSQHCLTNTNYQVII